MKSKFVAFMAEVVSAEWFTKKSEADQLKLIGLIERCINPWTVDEAINQRAALVKRIDECREDGYVAILANGRDCDCSQFENSLCRISVPATLMGVSKAFDEIYDSADGPVYPFVVKLSDYRAGCYTHTSRDLALEAFENGHSHVIYSSY